MDQDLDSFDLRLLQELQRDGRLTNNELADAIALSPSQCSRRRSRLEAEGYIRGYHADLDRQKLGFDMLVVISVTLATHSRGSAQKFSNLLRGLPEVLEAHQLTGEMDYHVKVAVRGLNDLTRLVNDILLPHESIQHVKTSIVLDTLKSFSGLPVSSIR
jgi:DNA-binding Lrp family transcriptional regulator